jgi:hypothetical protein
LVSKEADVTAVDLSTLGLPQVFAPREAADILRGLGLTEMTECALRTRAYRKQVPFHLNGRRIIFTLSDLREIAEGEARKPQSQTETVTRRVPLRSASRRRSPRRATGATGDTWRARKPHELRASADGART